MNQDASFDDSKRDVPGAAAPETHGREASGPALAAQGKTSIETDAIVRRFGALIDAHDAEVTALRWETLSDLHAALKGAPGLLLPSVVNPNGYRFDFEAVGILADLRGLAWSIDRRLQLFRQLAQAVEAMHAVGLVHGGLTPSHVFLDRDLRPHIDVFGAPSFKLRADLDEHALLYYPLTQVGAGSPSVIDDVYALGRMLHFILLERHPGVEEHSGMVLRLDELRGFPAVLTRIIRRATSHLPSMRYQSVEQLVDELYSHNDSQEIGVFHPLVRDSVPSRSKPEPRAETQSRRVSQRVTATWFKSLLALGLHHAFAFTCIYALALLMFEHRWMGTWLFVSAVMTSASATFWMTRGWWPWSHASRLCLCLCMLGVSFLTLPEPQDVAMQLRGTSVLRSYGKRHAKRAVVKWMTHNGRWDLAESVLIEADLSRLDLSRISFVAANLELADLRDSDLHFADLRASSLLGARLEGVDLIEAKVNHGTALVGASCDSFTLLPDGFVCQDGSVTSSVPEHS